MTTAVDDARSQAFDAFLRQRESEGYMIETRTGMQAVIYRRHRLHFLLRLVTGGSESRRLLVSVDQQAHVTSVAVKPAT
jgi:hypothetical protein